MQRAFLVILAVFLLLGAGATAIIQGVHTWRTDDTTEQFAVSTAAGVTTANVTLGGTLFQNATSEVVSITSNVTGESPIASAYTSATQVLLVAALTPNTTHTLTINYYADTSDSVVYAIGPYLALLIIGGCIVIIFIGNKGSKRRGGRW